MSGAPAVSVVVPCFNLGAYLDEAIDSVLTQTFPDFEIVIVDDGSTDPETRALLDGYVRPKTRVIRSLNRGLPAARNLGVRHTTGQYLCMLDADDRLEPAYMARSVEALDADPSLAFVSHWLRTFGDESWTWQPSACDLATLIHTNTVNGAALVRRDAFDEVGGFDELMREGLEDWDLWLRLVKRGCRGAIVPDVLFNYRRRSESMSRTLTDGDGGSYARLYGGLAAKHADIFVPRLGELVGTFEGELADMRGHLHDLEIEYFEWLEPELRRAEDDVAMLERKVAVERGRDAVEPPAVAVATDLAPLVPHPEASLSLARADAAALRASMSWRVTAPLRAVYGWWLRVGRSWQSRS